MFIYGSISSDSVKKIISNTPSHCAVVTCDASPEQNGDENSRRVTHSADSVKYFILKHANDICGLN